MAAATVPILRAMKAWHETASRSLRVSIRPHEQPRRSAREHRPAQLAAELQRRRLLPVPGRSPRTGTELAMVDVAPAATGCDLAGGGEESHRKLNEANGWPGEISTLFDSPRLAAAADLFGSLLTGHSRADVFQLHREPPAGMADVKNPGVSRGRTRTWDGPPASCWP